MVVSDTRFVLALGEDADRLEHAEGVNVLRRVRNVVLAEADKRRAMSLSERGEYMHVYRDAHDAFRALSVFE